MASPREVKRKLNRIKKVLRGTPGVDVKHESLKSAYFEGILSRGGRELSAFLMETVRQDGDWKRAAARKRDWIPRFISGTWRTGSRCPGISYPTKRNTIGLQWEYRKSHNLPYRERQDASCENRVEALKSAV